MGSKSDQRVQNSQNKNQESSDRPTEMQKVIKIAEIHFWPKKIAHKNGPKMTQNSPKMTQNGPKWPKMAQK